MTETESGQEKTEQPTAKKLLDAKKKGQVPRSKELSSMLVTISVALALIVFGGSVGNDLLTLLKHTFSPQYLNETQTTQLAGQFYTIFIQGLLTVVPLMAVALLASVVSSVALGGFTFALSFKIERLDPIKGFGKLFSAKSLVELLKSIAKLLFIGAAAVGLFYVMAEQVVMLGLQSPLQAIHDAGGLLGWFFLFVSLPLIAIAALDVPWQIFNHNKELRMTKQELRDEHKDTDGKPEVKSKIRELQQAAAQARMMDAVPEADVVITNPTHFAVALKYDEVRSGAPILVAKGADLVAARIREMAAANDVVLVESPRLARAIYASTKLNNEIPTGLYLAVAQILAWVYQLRQWHAVGGEYPDQPEPEVEDRFLGDLL